MSQRLASGAAAERCGDAVHTLQGRWERWGSAWAMHTACRGCGQVAYCRGRRRAWLYCFRCFAAGMVYDRRWR